MNRFFILSFLILYANLSLALTPNDLPIQLGASKKDARKLFGKPSKSGKHFDSFFHSGVTLVYSPSNKVISIEGSEYIDSSYYKGSIAGIALGDHIDKCVKLWGNYSNDSNPA